MATQIMLHSYNYLDRVFTRGQFDLVKSIKNYLDRGLVVSDNLEYRLGQAGVQAPSS